MNESNEIIEKEKLLKEIKDNSQLILLMLSGVLIGLGLMLGYIIFTIFGVN